MKPLLKFGQLLIILLLGACASRLATQSPENINLSGTWLLNQELSDNVMLSPSRQSSRKVGGRSGRGRQGTKPGGRTSGQRAGGSRSNGNTEIGGSGSRGSGGAPILENVAVMKAVEMTIEQNVDSMGVTYPNERYRDVDWGENKIGSIKVTAGWDHNRLVIKSDTERIDFTETYHLNSNGEVLTLTVAIKGNRGTKEFLRVFDRKAPED